MLTWTGLSDGEFDDAPGRRRAHAVAYRRAPGGTPTSVRLASKPAAPSAAPDVRAAWQVHRECPPDWADAMTVCQGSFFHTPLALRIGGERADECRFLRLTDGPRIRAIAALVLRRCRLSAVPRHARVATVPAVPPVGDAGGALLALREWLRGEGVADVTVDSFDAASDLDAALGGARTSRIEFMVPLGDDAENYARCTRHHQRCIDLGERERWAFRLLSGGDAASAVSSVSQLAAVRARDRGDAFAAFMPPGDVLNAASADGGWGTVTAAACAGGTLLAAAVVGWGSCAGFYIAGGSTPDGYARAAAAWLHWRIMGMLRARGLTGYNLGGVPGTAAAAANPAHGLHRFKAGFGAVTFTRSSLQWVLNRRHARAHAAARWLFAKAGS